VAPSPVAPVAPARTLIAVRRRHLELLLLVVVAVPLLFAAQGFELLDPDEGLYADIAKTMVTSGDWVLPRFNDLPYLEKPPLYFWLAALALAVDPTSEAATRLVSSVTALGSILLAWRIGARLYGPAAGLAAGLALATSVGYALYVRKASTDFVFVFCLTLALYGFLRDAVRAPASRSRFLLMYVGTALALLSKGLIGVVFPFVIVAATCFWRRAPGWRQLNVGWGLLAFAAVALPWHLVVAWREPGLTWFYVVDNQILRFLNLRDFLEDDIPVGTVSFFLVSFVWFFPWSVFAFARPAPAADEDGARWRVLLPVWAVVVILFFVASRSKLEYYALPAFPALAVMVGAAWANGRDVGRWMIAGLSGCVAVGVACVWLGAGLTPTAALDGLAELNVYYRILRDQGLGFPFASPRPFGQLLQALGIVLIAGWAAAALAWWRGWRRTSFAAVAACGAGIAVLIVRLIATVEPHHSAAPVSAALTRTAGASDVIVHEGSLEYSAALPFYTGRRIVVVDGARGDLDIASRRPEARGWFLDAAGLAARWTGSERVFLVTQRPRDKSVVARLPEATVHLVGRFGSRWLYSNRGT
jgi:4-amino-4-deoxy-L-arabinose transferase-like glycosyltransferase